MKGITIIPLRFTIITCLTYAAGFAATCTHIPAKPGKVLKLNDLKLTGFGYLRFSFNH